MQSVLDCFTLLTAPSPPNAKYKLLSSKNLSSIMSDVTSKPARDGLNAVPTTPQEKIDCAKFLTPQQQHQVVIGKLTINITLV